MSTFIGNIKEMHELGGIGLVIALDVSFEQLASDLKLRIDDQIELRDSSHHTLQTRIRGIAIYDPSPSKSPIELLMPREIEREKILLGMSVWKLH